MILSIQSHVAYGYVGNRVATFILQRMGFDVVTMNTVQFSNHTGYGQWTGDIFSVDHLQSLLEGLDHVGALKQCSVLLSGYLGSAQTADVVLKAYDLLKHYNPDLVYVCDPVMGDVGRGLFVKEDIPLKFRNDIIHKAFALTPNLFELEVLTQTKIQSMDDLKSAVLEFKNPAILVTSVDLPDLDPSKIHMVMAVKNEKKQEGEPSQKRYEFIMVSAPKFHFAIPPNGSGDAVSALFLGHYLRNRDLEKALDHTNQAMHHLFKMTHERVQQDPTKRELALIQAQDLFG